MKKYIISVLLLAFCLTLTGCGDKNLSAHLKVKCEDGNTEDVYKLKDTFACDVLADEFVFTIDKMSKNKINLGVSKTGLVEDDGSEKINMTQKNRSFVLKKGETLKLAFQLSEAHDVIEIEWDK